MVVSSREKTLEIGGGGDSLSLYKAPLSMTLYLSIFWLESHIILLTCD